MVQRKPYNPYTKYGRRKLREQARYNYESGSQEYKDDVDKTGLTSGSLSSILSITLLPILRFPLIHRLVTLGFSPISSANLRLFPPQ